MNSPQMIEAVFKLVYTFKMQLSSELETEGVSVAPMHMKILKMVSKMEECTALRIAKALNRDKAQVTRVLQELTSKGLVNREKNLCDKRSQILRLSQEGEDVLQKMIAIEEGVFARMSKNISAKDQKLFVTLAESLKKNIEN